MAFRIIARKDGKRVKLYSRPGNDLTERFPLAFQLFGRLVELGRDLEWRTPASLPLRVANTPALAGGTPSHSA
jgi:hypothetical protein